MLSDGVDRFVRRRGRADVADDDVANPERVSSTPQHKRRVFATLFSAASQTIRRISGPVGAQRPWLLTHQPHEAAVFNAILDIATSYGWAVLLLRLSASNRAKRQWRFNLSRARVLNSNLRSKSLQNNSPSLDATQRCSFPSSVVTTPSTQQAAIQPGK